ncbi:MAG: Stk1 family PASTA domain-containing Ser/Thr kinase [Actinomycetaceae bacterium]|nr:Stk1 family PASTA domain-containing Ser/Thr kinase [Actinomycetaceae bacterium]
MGIFRNWRERASEDESSSPVDVDVAHETSRIPSMTDSSPSSDDLDTSVDDSSDDDTSATEISDEVTSEAPSEKADDDSADASPEPDGQVLADPLIGMLIDGRYRVNQLLARGGMATVYVARDERLDRLVAIKVMHPHLAASQNFVHRFRREARSAARIIHPSVVSVFDQGIVAGSGYLVMELVDGPNLRTVLNREGSLTVGRALAYTEAVLGALVLAHRTGVIHRDIKPENVLIPSDGPIKVADFGLARAASDVSAATTGSVLGTVAYIAPELVTEGEPDPRSDLYALGIMLFEMITGHTPYEDRTAMQVAWAHVHEDIPAPSSLESWIPKEIDDVVCSFAARDPKDRPADAQAALDQLVRIRAELSDDLLTQRADVGPSDDNDLTDQIRLRGETVALPITEKKSQRIKTQAQPPRKKRRLPLVIATVLALVIAAGAAFSWWWFEYGPGSYIAVPNVVNVVSADAHETLETLNLTVQEEEAFDDDVAAGIVISTIPAPDEKVHKNGTVTIVVSKGIEMIEVPDLVGSSGQEFNAAIRQVRLSPGIMTEEYSETVAEGLIISLDPGPRQSIKHHSPVNVVVSKGREPITVPDVTGQTTEDATTALTDLGLQVTTSEEFSTEVEKGAVISQDPEPETILYRSDSVSLVISKGPEMTTVPNVVRMSERQAVNAIEARGLVVNVVRVLGALDLVATVEPGAGTSVPVGSTVTIRVV